MTSLPVRIAEPILVIGGYGYRNLGDEAILAGLLAELPGRRVTVVSRQPDETTALHGVDAIGIGQALTALRTHRTVVIGGGGLFGRDMGRVGRLLPAFGVMAAVLGREVVVAGVDVDGELTHAQRLFVSRLMRAAKWVGVRDRESVAILANWGVSAELGPDLSSGIRPASRASGGRLLTDAGIDLRRPLVAVALTGIRPDLGARAVGAVAAAMDAMPEIQFCFIPFSRHPFVPAHDDRTLGAMLKALQPRLVVLDEPGHPSVVLAALEHASAAVAMRYHAMVFAQRAGTPLVALPYAEKTRRFLAQAGLPAVDPDSREVTVALRAALSQASRTGQHDAPFAVERRAS
jgi:polysaccharide pyruvyl transferase WcaK-like protein